MSQKMPHQISRSTSHWYSDGSVILQVEDTQFRLHHSLLSKHFPVFTDAFTFIGPREIEDVEGCPVVKVAGDKVMDWENTLIVVYDPYLVYSTPVDYPMPVVLSTLRLAVKYEANHLRDMAATCLRAKIPTTLANWYASPIRDLEPHQAPPFVDHIFEIVNTAQELEFQSILPTAYLICLQLVELLEIVDVRTHKDGTTSSSFLSPLASRRIIMGWQMLMIGAVEQLVVGPMTRSPRPKNCKKRHFVQEPDSDNDDEWFNCDASARDKCIASRMQSLAINPATAFYTSAQGIRLCEVCSAAMETQLEEGRQVLWDTLPLIFGLPSWVELKDFGA